MKKSFFCQTNYILEVCVRKLFSRSQKLTAVKKILIGALAAALFCTSCQKAADTITQKLNVPAHTDGFTKYTIQQGNQFADGNAYKEVSLQEQRFLVKFDSSAIYTTQHATNQYDINKLYGFSDNKSLHHEFSARFGWRWSDGALRLFAYVYNNNVMTSKELKAVSIGKEIACSIKVSGSFYVFSVDSVTDTMPRASATAAAVGYQLYPYFGGDEVAPHAVSIWIKPIN